MLVATIGIAESYYHFYNQLTSEEKIIFIKGVIIGFDSAKILIEQDKERQIRHIEIKLHKFIGAIDEGIEPDLTSRIVREIRKMMWFLE
tara:strand:+ start:11440 stop:11706 length:267 start_codon:yes stop_codon:yes gene_type:complete